MVDRGLLKAKLTAAEARLNALKSHRAVTLDRFRQDSTLQAALLHHLQVAVQACCDIASHIVADEGWGVPGSSKELFDFLGQRRVMSISLAGRMQDLVGLRNLIVHGYDKLDLKRIHASLPERRKILGRFLKAVVFYAKL